MELAQYIYTSTCTDVMTPKLAYQVSVQSVSVCKPLGLTGRVFANRQSAFAITEGPRDMVQRYYDAVQADVLVRTIVLHSEHAISDREFTDYSVWLNLGVPFPAGSEVYELTPKTIGLALPKNPSTRLKLMAEAFLGDKVYAA